MSGGNVVLICIIGLAALKIVANLTTEGAIFALIIILLYILHKDTHSKIECRSSNELQWLENPIKYQYIIQI